MASVMLFFDFLGVCGEVSGPETPLAVLLYYFEQVTSHSIREMILLFQRKNISRLWEHIIFFERETVGPPLQYVSQNWSVLPSIFYELLNVKDNVNYGALLKLPSSYQSVYNLRAQTLIVVFVVRVFQI